MKIKNLGVDIDGVVARFNLNFSEAMLELYGKFIPSKDLLNNGELFMKYCESKPERCFDLPTYTDSIEVLKNLHYNHGININFITKRGSGNTPSVKEKTEELTIKWINNFFPFHNSCKFSDKKWEYAKNGSIDLMVEDDTRNAQEIAPFCPVLLMSRPWNMGLNLVDNVIPVEHWKEIEFYILNNPEFK